MPRLNDASRAELLKARVAEYEAAGLGDHRNARFARDMIARAARKKWFSAAQRKWVMSIIEDDLPTPKNAELVARIDEALEVVGLSPRTKEVLNDFRGKAFNGWALSEKQTSFMENLLTEASDIAKRGPWCPTAEEIEKIRLCIDLAKRYDEGYFYSHGGLAKAVAKGRLFLNEGATGEAASKFGFDEWCMNHLFKQFKTPLSELANPKHPAGEMRWAPVRTYFAVGPWNRGFKTTWHFSMVVDAPVVDDKGQVAYPMIVDGSFTNVASSNIKKRQPK